ncbi:MAG: hypothetical protein DMG62_09175 [Acidobacteria bacterium]|nr:MAG: hypothetical protein DMG62_09175 [Acidobacteriota bacterium]
MNSRQMIVGLLLAVGIAVLVLLITPVVHVPYIVLHGPMTALRAQRAAALFNAILSACASLFVGSLFALRGLGTTLERANITLELSSPPPHLSCSLRC